MEKAEQRAKFDEDMWSLQLEEVKITAPRIERKDEARSKFWLNLSSDVTLSRKEIVDYYFTGMDIIHFIQLLNPQIAGYEEDGLFHFYIQSRTLMGADPTVRVFIDGADVTDFFDRSQIYVDEIEFIDIIKPGPSATVLGIHGGGGAISMTTRRASGTALPKNNQFVHIPLGYQKPVEFYSPKYETSEPEYSRIPDYRTTLFWKPDIVILDAGDANFEFYTSDFSTTYSVVIEGLTTDGKIIRQVERIQIK